MAQNSGESLTDAEQMLVRFDQEKQTPNDSGAMLRQYRNLRDYMTQEWKVELPETIEVDSN